MTLVDTSVWIEHFRAGDPAMTELLLSREVLTHPFVIGELALGALHPRHAALGMLLGLTQSVVADHGEVMGLIERNALHGAGIGYVDAHLLAATRLTRDAVLWSRDRRLSAAAARLGIATRLPH